MHLSLYIKSETATLRKELTTYTEILIQETKENVR